MTSFAIKSLIALTFIAGTWNPMGADLVSAVTGRPAPVVGCSPDLAVCEIGATRFRLAEKNSVIGEIVERTARKDRMDRRADRHVDLAAGEGSLFAFLDKKLLPAALLSDVQTMLTEAANRTSEENRGRTL